MSQLSLHWRSALGWIFVSSLYGLLWGGVVALLFTIQRPPPNGVESTLPMVLLAHTKIGLLAGAFFGALAGFIAVIAYHRIVIVEEPGSVLVGLLVCLALWFAGQGWLIQTFGPRFFGAIDWHSVALRGQWWLQGATLTIPFLALLPLSMVSRILPVEGER